MAIKSPLPNSPKPAEEESIGSWLDSRGARLAGAAAALTATWITARDAIRRAYFKSLNKEGADTFADLQRQRDEKIGRVVAPAREGVEVADAMDRVLQINREYDTKLTERQRNLGVHSVFDEAKALKRHQWMEVVMATGTVAAVALGAILAIASNRDIAHKQRELEGEIDGANGQKL